MSDPREQERRDAEEARRREEEERRQREEARNRFDRLNDSLLNNLYPGQDH